MARKRSPKIYHRRELARKKPNRSPYDRILIVCEGSQTEPNYFENIRKTYRLPNVTVDCDTGKTQPSQVIAFALELFDRKQKVFEKVFAVFDRDDHPNYFQALDKAKTLNGKHCNDGNHRITFRAISSSPNFELWLLLHYQDVQHEVSADDVQRLLRNSMPDYKKSMQNLYAITKERFESAHERARRLARLCKEDKALPYTDVDELVKQLRSLKPPIS